MSALVRVARRPDGTVEVDRTAPGRGAWLCGDPVAEKIREACLARSERSHGLQRAFRAPVTPAAVEALRGRHAERERMESDVASEAT